MTINVSPFQQTGVSTVHKRLVHFIEAKGKLPASFKRKWLKALRSGDFQQGDGTLKDIVDEGVVAHCCLGVACEVAGKTDRFFFDPLVGVPPGAPKYDIIPKHVKEVPALLRGEANDNPVVEKLTTMNDTGVPFTDIADWIEENL